MSTFLPRKRTPSASSRSRCSIAESPRSLISPPAPSTRCQGNPYERCRTRATRRAAPAKPAARAMPPYVETLPRGMLRIVASIRIRIAAARSSRVFVPRADLRAVFRPAVRPAFLPPGLRVFFFITNPSRVDATAESSRRESATTILSKPAARAGLPAAAADDRPS
jgi:hypothetical protein